MWVCVLSSLQESSEINYPFWCMHLKISIIKHPFFWFRSLLGHVYINVDIMRPTYTYFRRFYLSKIYFSTGHVHNGRCFVFRAWYFSNPWWWSCNIVGEEVLYSKLIILWLM
jgi:hypothetical protein